MSLVSLTMEQLNASISGMTKLFSRLPSIWNKPSFGFNHSIPSLLVA